jgi:hypothetical protein
MGIMSQQWYVKVAATAELSNSLTRHSWTMSSVTQYPDELPKICDGVHYLNTRTSPIGSVQVYFVSRDPVYAKQVAVEWIRREQQNVEYVEKLLRDWSTITATVTEQRSLE